MLSRGGMPPRVQVPSAFCSMFTLVLQTRAWVVLVIPSFALRLGWMIQLPAGLRPMQQASLSLAKMRSMLGRPQGEP
jgi:hypothetical protein